MYYFLLFIVYTLKCNMYTTRKNLAKYVIFPYYLREKLINIVLNMYKHL